MTSISGKTTEIISPIDGTVLGSIQQVTYAEVDRAIIGAKSAQKEWVKVPMVKRAKILHLVADWLREHESFFTTLLIKEIGKSYKEAKDEILRSADMIEYFANEALNLHGEELSGDAYPGYDQTKTAIVERVPLGVVLAISPFNYPVNLSVSKIAPALITGNAVIFKPPAHGSIVSLFLTEVFKKAGVPAGLLATLTGEGNYLGDYLVTHRDIDMVTFTGSSTVGKKIAAEIGMIPLLFECGGNNPALVLPDADLDMTASELVTGAFSYSGQRCTAIKYVLCFKPTLEKLIPKIIKKTRDMFKTGDPRIESNNLGPLITDDDAILVEKRILEAVSSGAEIVYGGSKKGRIVEPTILKNARPSMEIVHTETFGPVLSFIEIKSIEEAFSIINSSGYGLQMSIFTSDEGTGINLAKTFEVGSVLINSKPQRGPDHFPFIGVKDSGVGVQGIRYTLEAMTRLKPVILNKPH